MSSRAFLIKPWLVFALAMIACSLHPFVAFGDEDALVIEYAAAAKHGTSTFFAYQVGEIDDDLIDFYAPFDKVVGPTQFSDDDALIEASAALESYIASHECAPCASARTDETGEAVFDNLDESVYLVTGSASDQAWTPQSFFTLNRGVAYPKTAVYASDVIEDPLKEPVQLAASDDIDTMQERGDVFAKTDDALHWLIATGTLCALTGVALMCGARYRKRSQSKRLKARFGQNVR